MQDYQTFHEELRVTYPSHGHALWDPDPSPDIPVEVGDVGYIREGKFYRLFNALVPAGNFGQRLGVPENYEPLSTSSPMMGTSSSVEHQMYFCSRHDAKASRGCRDENYCSG